MPHAIGEEGVFAELARVKRERDEARARVSEAEAREALERKWHYEQADRAHRLEGVIRDLVGAIRAVDTYVDFSEPAQPNDPWMAPQEPDGMNEAMAQLHWLMRKHTPCAEPPCFDDVRCANHPWECGDGCLRRINHDGDCCPRAAPLPEKTEGK